MVEMQHKNPESLALLPTSHTDCEKSLGNVNAFGRINFTAQVLQYPLLTTSRDMRHTKLGHEDEPLQETKNLQVRKMRMIIRRIF
jgi:hypothetical protein